MTPSPGTFLEMRPIWQRDLGAVFMAVALGMSAGLAVTELSGVYAIVWWLCAAGVAAYSASLAGGRVGVLISSNCVNLALMIGFQVTRGFAAVEHAMLDASQFDTGTRQGVDHEIWMTFLTAQCLCLLIGFGVISGLSAERRRIHKG